MVVLVVFFFADLLFPSVVFVFVFVVVFVVAVVVVVVIFVIILVVIFVVIVNLCRIHMQRGQ